VPAAYSARSIRWRVQAMTLLIVAAPVLSVPRTIDPSSGLAPRPPRTLVQAIELLRDEPTTPAGEDLDALDATPPDFSAAMPARAEVPAATHPVTTTRPTTTTSPFLRGLYTGSARTSIESRGKSHVIWMEVTAYCPCPICCGARARGVTASGKPVTANDGFFVAADADRLPFGAKVRIPGYHDGQTVEVLDRGSAILGPRLDVFFPTHEEAMAWGRQWLPVTVEGD
jgi:3D (Asp-Asp-Asp) domain-containing protein